MSERRTEVLLSMVKPLCNWFEHDHREMYWRSHPTPYYVWISEIMLQQTRVEAVRGYFERFIREFPDVKSLSEADDDRLMKLWEGLGYYNRARNLKKAANIVVREYGGNMPSCYKELLKLPGIGEYTAGAIASIAFKKAEPAVDGNVLRVLMRILNDDADILKESVKREIRQDLKKIMPKEKPGIFNQALMELGAVVCVPNGLPKCSLCPLKEMCQAEKMGIAHDLTYAKSLPYKTPKKARKVEDWTVFLFERDGKIAVGRRSEKGLLAGMWEFPNLSGRLRISQVQILLREAGIDFEQIEPLGNAKHIFSHREWHMTGYRIVLKTLPFVMEEEEYSVKMIPVLTDLLKECSWELPKVIKEQYSLPSAFETYKQKLERKEKNVIRT